VHEYLSANPDLLPLLTDARSAIAEYFGQQARAAIDLAYDMESDTEEPELIVSIFSDAADRLQLLHKFDEGWWLRQSAREGGRVLIDLAYR
jgi:hypothetical protein